MAKPYTLKPPSPADLLLIKRHKHRGPFEIQILVPHLTFDQVRNALRKIRKQP